MDFANRGNRPTQAPGQSTGAQNEQPSQSQPAFQPPTNNNKKNDKKVDFGKLTSILMLIGIVVLVSALVIGMVFGKGSSGPAEEELILDDRYQAVFLDSQDGQVYFGRLEVYNHHLYRLSDIYYVRVEQPIQPEGADQQQEPNISLAKLGNELHGPEDTMFISRDKVLYWENLKNDGQVVTAITEFKANEGEENGQTEQPQQPQQPQQQQDEGATGGTQPVGTPEEDDTPPATEPEETPVTP